MMRFGLERLRELWPTASLEVLTRNPSELLRLCGDVTPVPYSDWYADHFLLGRVHRRVPAALSKALVSAKVRVRRLFPSLEEGVVRWKLRLIQSDRRDFELAAAALREADAVVVSGAGGICDTFPSFSVAVLRTLEIAIRRGKSTALFSHGFGPLENKELLTRARAVLPFVDLIGLRESRFGPSLLASLGVDARRIMVTGDDGIAVSFAACTDRAGTGIGVNVRTGPAAGVEEDLPNVLAPVIQAFARQRGAPLVPLPIALQRDWDAGNIERLARGYTPMMKADGNLDTPESIVGQVGRCRIVVSGAYHAAVFALAQGIPAVGLVSSPHYAQKFLGLADIFGAGCTVVDLKRQGLERRLAEAIEAAWDSAERVREPLRARAARQLRACGDAYRRFGEIVAARALDKQSDASQLPWVPTGGTDSSSALPPEFQP